MYCPKCGDELDESGTEIQCVRGQMGLSQHLARGLYASFVARTVPPRELGPASFRWGGVWFCPGCGIEMKEVVGTNGVLCPACKGNLGPFIYEIVEFHPHRFGDKWG